MLPGCPVDCTLADIQLPDLVMFLGVGSLFRLRISQLASIWQPGMSDLDHCLSNHASPFHHKERLFQNLSFFLYWKYKIKALRQQYSKNRTRINMLCVASTLCQYYVYLVQLACKNKCGILSGVFIGVEDGTQ